MPDEPPGGTDGAATVDTIRVLVADDHPLFRQGARVVLEAASGIDWVAEATTGTEAVVLAAESQPDVAVMDIRMPDINGIEATRRIVQTSPHIKVLVLTMLQDDDSVFAAIRAGARGYLLKDAPPDEFIRAVRAVANGEVIFGPAIARRVITVFSGDRPVAPDPFPDLTARERQILELVAAGHNSPTIARRLDLSPKTVRNHVSNILNKLQVADRAAAIIRARDAGLGVEPP